jgi:glucan-binding YG repeat protein
MEAPEVPTEHLHEQMEEHAEHGAKWVIGVALSSAIIAALAAVSSLLAGHNVDEGMISQMRASDQWNYYQAKGVKGSLVQSKVDMMKAIGKTPDQKDIQKIAQYKKDQEEIKENADSYQENSKAHMENHHLAEAVTIFQICIALGAISALTKKKAFWFVSLIGAAGGIYLLTLGYGRWHAAGLEDERIDERVSEQQNPNKHEGGEKHEGAAKHEAGNPEGAAKHEAPAEKHEAAAPAAEHKPEAASEAPAEPAAKPEGEPKAN